MCREYIRQSMLVKKEKSHELFEAEVIRTTPLLPLYCRILFQMRKYEVPWKPFRRKHADPPFLLTPSGLVTK
jgi:hypothetical protein